MSTDINIRTLYQSRSKNTGCLLVHATRHVFKKANIESYRSANAGPWTFTIIPSFLKVNPSIMSYLSESQTNSIMSRIGKSKHTQFQFNGPNVDSKSLEIAFSVGALRSESITEHAKVLTKTLHNLEKSKIAMKMTPG